MWKTKNSVLTDANRTTATQISDSKGVSASKDNQQSSENQNTDKKDTTLASQAKAWVVKQFGVKAGSIHIITDVSQIPASQRAAIDAISKGIGVTAWVSGDIYLYLPNILEFAKNQGENALDNIKAKVFHELVAHFAEKKAKGILTKAEQSTWDKILALFKEILSKIGLKNLTEQDLENIILASYQYSVNSGNSGTAPNANSRFSAERRLTDKIESIFEDVVKGNLKGKPISIGKLSAEGRDYLLQISGINFKKDVDFVLNPSDLQHIYNEHYGENEKDKGNNIPLSMYDIRRIVDVIMYPDEIVFGVDEKGRKVFAFLMESSNGTYNLFEIYADAKGNLTSKSYYKTKKGVSQRAMSIKNSLHSTSKTDEATLFDAKIPQLFDSSITNDNNSRFSISERKRTEYELQIKKHNKTISDVQLKESLDFLDELEDNKQNTKAIKIAVKWLADGTIMLPYGMDNIRKAIALCEKNGIDPMSFKDPMEIINKYSVDVEYGKAVDPDKVSVFTDKRIITTENGDDVVVYDVEDSVAGQEAVCRICHQHFGYSTKTNGSKQPWCLASFTRQGEPTQSAQRYWHNTYTSVGKKIAFMDGKPIAFMAHSESYEGDLWWDLNDQSSNNLPLPNGDYILPDGEITERYSSDDADITDDAYEEAVRETASLTTTSGWCDILQFMYGKCIYEGEYRKMAGMD